MSELQTVLVSTLVLGQDGKQAVIGGVADAPSTTAPAPTGEVADGSASGVTRPSASPMGSNMIFIGMLFFLGFLVISSMMQGRKEKRRKAALLSGIARHDRVQTVGGIIGVVAEISEDEVVLRVDESTNSRVRVSRSSIQQVLKKGRGSSLETEAKPTEVEAVS
jgi:preprotein translocase subunit YajC